MLTAASNTTVTLTEEELERAAIMAKERHVWAEARGYFQTDGTKSKNGFANHIRGAAGEIAAAKLYELEWDATMNGFRKIPDLVCCEIRTAGPRDPYLRIKIRDKETKASWPFISATNLENRQFRIEGWCFGYEGMKDEFWVAANRHTGQPEWQVPHKRLHAPFTLAETLLKLRELYRDDRFRPDWAKT